MRKSSNGLLAGVLLLGFLISSPSFSDSVDWYSYYVQCVATSTHESTCYEAIRDYLMTEEGRKRAQELGFKRRLQIDIGQISSQAVVVSTRIGQMDKYLESMLMRAKEEGDPVLSYCLQEKKTLIADLVKSADEKKQALVSLVSQSNQSEKLESDYQMLLSINSRANEIYLQAQKCIQ